MNWLERAISYALSGLNTATALVCGSFVLTLLIVIPILVIEAKIRKDK